MSTVSKVWAAVVQALGSGDGFATLSGTTESFSSDVDLETDGYEGAHVIVEVDFDATPTDNVLIGIYGSLDGTNFDDIPAAVYAFDKAIDPNQQSFIVTGYAHFRVGAKQTGSTNSHDVRVYHQRFRYQVV